MPSIVLMFGLFRSRRLAVVLAAAGLLYGGIGILRLGVVLDAGLLLGAVALMAATPGTSTYAITIDRPPHAV